MTPETMVSVIFLSEIEIVTAKLAYSKSLKIISRQLFLTMNVLKDSNN